MNEESIQLGGSIDSHFAEKTLFIKKQFSITLLLINAFWVINDIHSRNLFHEAVSG